MIDTSQTVGRQRPPFDATGAACAGSSSEIFFPEGFGEDDYARARSICAHCPIQEACLRYALDNHENYGMWGGATEAERVGLRRLEIGSYRARCDDPDKALARREAKLRATLDRRRKDERLRVVAAREALRALEAPRLTRREHQLLADERQRNARNAARLKREARIVADYTPSPLDKAMERGLHG
jgi:WhiB family transcriptional regulator, redox-sensing transcriptional regulator